MTFITKKLPLLSPASLLMLILSWGAAIAADPSGPTQGTTLQNLASQRFVLNMVFPNPGEPAQQTKWDCPATLKAWSYTGQIPLFFVQCAIPFTSFDATLVPEGSEPRRWVDSQAAMIDANIRVAKQAGIALFPFIDVLVVPKTLIEKYGPEMKTGDHLDIRKPMTQEVIQKQLAEVFDRFPDLAGLTLRFGETYLHDTPHHVGGRPVPSADPEAIEGHITLLKLLRDEICVKRNKVVCYRTWDFNQFHDRPDFYLKVTDAVEPHPNLIFSIKHQLGDFHRLSRFNTTLGIGKHRQIVEVECQLEYYGKGAHPYYNGQGVIDGWEEYAWTMKPGQPKGLRDIAGHVTFAGVSTWSRGGGWEGPFIVNELWCDLNACVVSQFALNPNRTEEDIFNEYARRTLGLNEEDVKRFRELSLLSAAAVLRGQISLKGDVNVWWARDDYLETPDLNQFVKGNLVKEVLAEKAEAVRMWKRIEELARQIHFANNATQQYAEVSCTYGRIKYAIIEQAWTILLYGAMGDASKNYDKAHLTTAIAEYDRLWAEWRQLKAKHPCCATLYKDTHSPWSGVPGLGQTVDRYRKVLTEGQ